MLLINLQLALALDVFADHSVCRAHGTCAAGPGEGAGVTRALDMCMCMIMISLICTLLAAVLAEATVGTGQRE